MRMHAWLLIGLLATSFACSDDDIEELAPLPENPQIQNAGYLAFPLSAPNESRSSTITVANLGRQTLVISDIRLVGQDAARFTLGEPRTREITIRSTVQIPVTFNGAGSGAYVARVEITSNAENATLFPVDVLAPVGDQQAAQLATAEDSLDIAIPAGASEQRATLRLYNIGRETLTLTDYAFTGAGAAGFSLATGTPEPGTQCRVNEFDCPSSLFCNLPTPGAEEGTCAASIATGGLIVLDIYYGGQGSQNASFDVTSTGGNASVPLRGTR